MSFFQPVGHLTATQTVEQIFSSSYQNGNNQGSLFCFAAIVFIALGLFFASAAIKEEKRSKSRNKTSHENSWQDDDGLAPLVPVEASVSPVAEHVVVLEPAPVSVIDLAPGWSKSECDEAVLSIPAYIRKAGLTPYQAGRRMFPLKTPVVLIRDMVQKSDLDSMPVFDLGERMHVGFDGVPVH